MMFFGPINTNTNGVPYLRTNGVTVSAESVDFALGFRRIPRICEIAVNIADAIPEGTTGTLPVRFTLNGNTRTLTYFGGDPVTAADLSGTGIVKIYYDWFSGIFQLTSVTAAPAAAAAADTNS